MNKTKRVIAMAGLPEGLVLAGAPAFAQTSVPTAPANHEGAMMDHGMPNSQGGMMHPEMQQKMSKDNCNRMMDSMMQNKGGMTNKG